MNDFRMMVAQYRAEELSPHEMNQADDRMVDKLDVLIDLERKLLIKPVVEFQGADL